MSAPADVLAVIAGAIEGTEQALVALRGKNRIECIEALEDLKEAHDAVAELIGAVDRLTDSASSMNDGWDEAVAALARVKGA